MRRRQGLTMVMAFLLMLFGLYYGSRVQQYNHSMSVKYENDGLTASQIDGINRKGEEETDEELPYVTGYLKQKDMVVENKRLGRSMSLTMVGVYGEMSEAFPARIYRGSFVQKADASGCVISITAAEHLFGNKSVVGCTLFVRGTPYVIRGIIKETEALLLVQEKGNAIFPCLELRYDRDNYPASNTKALLLRLGLSDYESFTEGNFYGGIAGLFMGLPFLALFISLTGNKLQNMKGMGLKHLLLLILFIIVLILIVRKFVSFSEDFIPPQVSDFEFWPELFQRIRKDHGGVLRYQTWAKDKQIIGNVRGCIGASLMSACLFSTIKYIK